MIELLSTILGALLGGSGSALSTWLGMRERAQSHQHELRLLEMQLRAKASETEREEAIAEHTAHTDMLIALVWRIWFTISEDDTHLRLQIIDGTLFMASAALTWWFGDRAPKNKLPWQ